MIERRKLIGIIAKKPPFNGLLNRIHIVNNFFSHSMCKWIIDEANKYALKNGGWTVKRHKNYPTTDIPITYIPSLSTPLMNYCIAHILPLISKNYKMNYYFLSISDLFIVKYDVDGQNYLDWHRDGSIISFNILLNDDFTDGGTAIEHISENGTEERIYNTNKGDLLIHPGKLKHSGLQITSGSRYILVGFIEYCFRITRGVNMEENSDSTDIHKI